MNSILNEGFTALIILIGSGFSLISAIGLLRLPDVYTRAHAASKSSTLGVLFVLLGTFLYFLTVGQYFSTKLLLGIFFVFLTAPVSAHMICRSAYRSRVEMVKTSVRDDLAPYMRSK
ncbi:MAG TPA: monovalent cation/H(+) antiporter subunit G [Syntrophomonadaceae bacterium]|nr:monovalent cation/H(+) antiporter subunit G [Syntrophomonadaceae bacterium]